LSSPLPKEIAGGTAIVFGVELDEGAGVADVLETGAGAVVEATEGLLE
jgi:hypothetical protein